MCCFMTRNGLIEKGFSGFKLDRSDCYIQAIDLKSLKAFLSFLFITNT